MGLLWCSDSKESACNARDLGSIPRSGRSPGGRYGNPLQGMATYFNILAWRIPWTEEPEELQSMGCKESDTTEHLRIAQQHTYHYVIYHNFFFYLPIMDIWVITHLESFQIRLYGHLCTSLLWTHFHFSHFFSLLFLLGSRMSRSFDRWIFNFLREYETIFPSSCMWLSWLL